MEGARVTLGLVARPDDSPEQRVSRRNHWARRNPDDYVRYPRLTPLTYLTLCRLVERAQGGDIESRNTVWEHNLRLALAVANRFPIPEPILADAVQEGALGLARAIAKFDRSRLNDFSTYAWHWVWQHIGRYLANDRFGTRIPVHLWADYHRFRHDADRLLTRADRFDWANSWLARDPTLYRTLYTIHGLATARTDLDAESEVRSQQSPEPAPLQALAHAETIEAIRTALGSLRPTERDILIRRYGLFDRAEQTLEEVGQVYGVTRERVRQIQQRAERRLTIFLAPLARSLGIATDSQQQETSDHADDGAAEEPTGQQTEGAVPA